jgi:L-lactate dehydrogenase
MSSRGRMRLSTLKGVEMKVGVIGIGSVGTACAMSLLQRGCAEEIVLVNRDEKRATSVATDMRYGVPVLSPVNIRQGSYDDLTGADLVMITAGVNEKNGGATDKSDPEGRLRLLDANVQVYRDIVPQVVRAAPQAVLMIVTDPPDPLADLTRALAGHDRVFSAGTVIDTLRFRTHVADRLNVNAESVYALVIGEHGTSEVFLWSSVRIGGLSFDQACAKAGLHTDTVRQGIEDDVRFANITIIEGNNASQYGIGIVCARLAQAVLRDEKMVYPVANYHSDYGLTLSLPSVLGRAGVTQSFLPEMSDTEHTQFLHCVEQLKAASQRIGVVPKN